MMANSRSKKRLRVRPGGPPKGLAADVERRILDAAQKLFLEKGFRRRDHRRNRRDGAGEQADDLFSLSR